MITFNELLSPLELALMIKTSAMCQVEWLLRHGKLALRLKKWVLRVGKWLMRHSKWSLRQAHR